ncbi:MAG TPA: flagellar hook capping FlgD N-terminal domain-containing protein [Halalkalibaculum sp.]|nr:flagellar hook capping FlgD N-terminal domain-containing protein [Halalkalibaculum sp.]
MDISNINSMTSAAFNRGGTDKTGKKDDLGQQEFLQLLVAQMQNQDPINPMDGAKFASQLAQFNSVEQLINVNSGLKSLQSTQDMMSASLTNSMAASLTGKQVKALSNQVYLSSGEDASVQFKLNNSADRVEIVIRDGSGSEVRRESLGGMASGDNGWLWDGRNGAGHRMADGEYSVEILASNGDSKVDSLAYIEGMANKVRYSGNGVYLSVNNVQVPIGNVEEVGTDIF